MSGAGKPHDWRYGSAWALTPLDSRTRHSGPRSAPWAFLVAVCVQVALTGAVLALFLFVLPFVGMVLGAALGIDMTVIP